MLVELFCNIFKPLGDETEDDRTHAEDRNSVEMMATALLAICLKECSVRPRYCRFCSNIGIHQGGNENVQGWASRDER